MPTYEYQCPSCGHSFERFQMMSERPVKKCPKCSRRKVVRLIGTGAGLIFKGSGFYVTDYRKSGSSANGGKNGSTDGAKSEPAPTEPSKAEPSKTTGADATTGDS